MSIVDNRRRCSFLEAQGIRQASGAETEAESEGVPVSAVTSLEGGNDTSEEAAEDSVDALTSVEKAEPPVSVDGAESVAEVLSEPVSGRSEEGGEVDASVSVVPPEESVETSGVPVSVEVSEGVPVFVDEASVCVEVEADVEVEVDVEVDGDSAGGKGSISGFSPSPIHSDFTSTA